MMEIFGASISQSVHYFLSEIMSIEKGLFEINEGIRIHSGIIKFFETEENLQEIREEFISHVNVLNESERAEYGDFQTNGTLAMNVTQFLAKKTFNRKC